MKVVSISQKPFESSGQIWVYNFRLEKIAGEYINGLLVKNIPKPKIITTIQPLDNYAVGRFRVKKWNSNNN